MLTYFGGCERPNAIVTLAKAGGRRVMISYAEPPTENCWRLYKKHGIEIMADSGAYSAWTRGAAIDIDKYMEWLQENKIGKYFNLDVIGDTEATKANQQYMEMHGYNPIPVFHFGEPLNYLDELVKNYDYIGLGGTVGKPRNTKVNWFSCIFSRYPMVKFHALGVANPFLLRQFPFYSTDSIWWLWKWRDKNKRYSGIGNCRKVEQAARIRVLLDIEGETKSYQPALF